MGTFYNENTYNYEVNKKLPANAIKQATIDLIGTTASFKVPFSKPVNQLVISTWGNSTANALGFGPAFFNAITKQGDILEGFDTTTPVATTNDNPYSVGNLRIKGRNGFTLEALIADNYVTKMVDADNPDIVVCMLLINDIRTGTPVAKCRKMVRQFLKQIFAKKPEMCVVLCIENSLGADFKNSNGDYYYGGNLVETPQTTTVIGQVSVPPGENKLMWGAQGRPSSIDRVGQEVIIAKGTSNEETVKVLELTDTYFVANLTKTQLQNATVQATIWGAAQAASTALRESILPFVGCDPRVQVIDFQSRIFGLEPPVFDPTTGNPLFSELMNDPLHPSATGEAEKAKAVAEVLTKLYFKDL